MRSRGGGRGVTGSLAASTIAPLRTGFHSCKTCISAILGGRSILVPYSIDTFAIPGGRSILVPYSIDTSTIPGGRGLSLHSPSSFLRKQEPSKTFVPRFREDRLRVAGHNRQGRRECRFCREQKSAKTASPRQAPASPLGKVSSFAAGFSHWIIGSSPIMTGERESRLPPCPPKPRRPGRNRGRRAVTEAGIGRV